MPYDWITRKIYKTVSVRFILQRNESKAKGNELPKVAQWINRKGRALLLLWTFCLSLTALVPTPHCYIIFWLLSNSGLNQRPTVSWSSTTILWQQWDCERKNTLGETRDMWIPSIISACLPAEVLFCWALY